MNFQRDAFISAINDIALKNKDIVFLSADFGAPALDKFRQTLPNQFFHLGISEQNLIDVAIGLALKGKIVITYAMAPFISLRCAEQHKIAAMMELPIINLIAGVGLGYANAGPTHYSTEDYALALNTIGSTVITTADAPTATACAKYLIENPRFCFVRMDRSPGDDLSNVTLTSFERGYRTFFSGKKIAVVSHGYMVSKMHRMFEKDELLSGLATLFDVFCSKPIPSTLLENLSNFKDVIVIDEQIENSSIGLYLFPFLMKTHEASHIHRFHLKEAFMFGNDGRDALIKEAGIEEEKIRQLITIRAQRN